VRSRSRIPARGQRGSDDARLMPRQSGPHVERGPEPPPADRVPQAASPRLRPPHMLSRQGSLRRTRIGDAWWNIDIETPTQKKNRTAATARGERSGTGRKRSGRCMRSAVSARDASADGQRKTSAKGAAPSLAERVPHQNATSTHLQSAPNETPHGNATRFRPAVRRRAQGARADRRRRGPERGARQARGMPENVAQPHRCETGGAGWTGWAENGGWTRATLRPEIAVTERRHGAIGRGRAA